MISEESCDDFNTHLAGAT